MSVACSVKLVELDNVQRRAERNSLNLNCSKSTEKIVFRDGRRLHAASEPVAPLPGIARNNCMKIPL